jgi:hypothetical protein
VQRDLWSLQDAQQFGLATSDVRALAGLSRAAHDLSGRVRAIDLNPVAVLPEGHGVRVLDAQLERPR